MAVIVLWATATWANAPIPTTQVDRELLVPLGGLEQWISIRGDDASHPVLLVVQGGPGEAQWPAADIFKPWERAFTVVQWDQRGTGHTYGRYGQKTPDVTLDRISKDGVEPSAYLCSELHKKKITVLGHSWGSLVAVHMVQLRPELFAAYVGTGQVSSWAANVNTQFDLHLAKARREGDEARIKKLEARSGRHRSPQDGVRHPYRGFCHRRSGRSRHADLRGRRLLQLREGTEKRTRLDDKRRPLSVDDRVGQVPGCVGLEGAPSCDRARA